MRKLIGCVVFIFIIVLVVWLTGTPVSMFWDMPSFITVIGITGTLLFTKYSFKEISSFSDEVASSAINFSLLSGGLGYIIGIVQILQNMSDPTKVGVPLAVCLLSVFYSILFSILIQAMRREIKFSSRLGKIGLSLAVATTLPFALIVLSLKMNG